MEERREFTTALQTDKDMSHLDLILQVTTSTASLRNGSRERKHSSSTQATNEISPLSCPLKKMGSFPSP